MPRITGDQFGGLFFCILASMRPGRNAPDNVVAPHLEDVELAASMRPGRNAPDNLYEAVDSAGESRASMRPGRNAPDNQTSTYSAGDRKGRFNEAGAKCPG